MFRKKLRIGVLGGITVDIEGRPDGGLRQGESNPGGISVSYGGVGRNIAENLARLGASVQFVSLTGDDFAGRNAAGALEALGVDVSGIRRDPEKSTAMCLSVLDPFGDLQVGLCNMGILENAPASFCREAAEALSGADMVGLDANLPEAFLEEITDRLRKTPLFLDPVSAAKAGRAGKILRRFHTIKPNRAEAEILSGLTILNEEQLKEAGRWFSEAGVRRIFITLSGGGVYYKEGDKEGILRPEEGVTPVSVTGAGDAFSAAVLYGGAMGLAVRQAACLGMAAAAIAMEAGTPVNPSMTEKAAAERAKYWAKGAPAAPAEPSKIKRGKGGRPAGKKGEEKK